MRKSTHYFHSNPCVLLFYGYYTPHREGRYIVPFILHGLRTITHIKQFCKGITMKKTILAVAIAATSFGTLAADKGQPERPERPERPEYSTDVKVDAFNLVLEKANLESKVMITKNANGTYSLIQEGKAAVVLNNDNEAQFKQTLAAVAQKNSNDRRNDRETIIVEPIPTMPSIPVSREDAIAHLKTGSDVLNNEIALELAVEYRLNNENAYQFSGSEKLEAVNRITGAEFQVHYDLEGNTFLVNKTTGEQLTPEQVKEMAIAARVQVQEEAAKRSAEKPSLPDAPIEDMPVTGLDPERAKEAVQELVNAAELTKEELAIYANTQVSQQALTDAQQDASIAQNANDINTLFSEVERLDSRIDQTQALNAATVNARPMVTNGMTAFGAGVGYAGSEAAISVGVAHSFVDTGWSTSGTLAASADDFVVGGGVQYAF